MGTTAADLLKPGQPYWRLYTFPEALNFYKVVLEVSADDAETQRAWRRRLCLTDLFYLLVYELNRPDVSHPWLYMRCREVENNPDGFIDLWAREHYKDIADTTPVLTANRGWQTHGEIRVGDMVFSPSGEPIRVVALSKKYKDSKCYEIKFVDGSSVVAGAGHLWRIRQKIKRRVKHSSLRRVEFADLIVTTEQLADMRGRRDVGVCASLEGSYKELPLHPYVLGAWLGDGTTGHPYLTAGVDDADAMVGLIRSCGVPAVGKLRNTRHVVNIRMGTGVRGKRGSSDVSNALRKIGVLYDKHIPAEYLTCSVDQRFALLQGLMDTDGCCNTRGTAQFTSAKEPLARQVFDLAASLGLRPRIGCYWIDLDSPKSINGKYCSWKVSFQAHRDRCPFRMPRKAARCIKPSNHRDTRSVKSVKPVESVPTRCIQVDGGMYVVGRELIPTHNSSIITFAQNIQEILKNQQTTIGLFSHTKAIAQDKFLLPIKTEFENNANLYYLFPEVLYENPERQSPRWNSEAIVVKRTGTIKEATIEAHGIMDGMPTGSHFDILHYDDLITQKHVTSPEMVKKATENWELSLSLGKEGGRQRYVGTFYAVHDTYRAIIDRGAAKPRTYPCVRDVDNENFNEAAETSVLMTPDELRKRYRDMAEYVFSCQYLLKPKKSKSMGFHKEWLKFWGVESTAGLNIFILVDPSSGKKREADDKRNRRDYTAMLVIGRGVNNTWRVIDIVRDKLSLHQRRAVLKMLHQTWGARWVFYEEVGMQSDLQYFQEAEKADNYPLDVIALNPREMGGDKYDRIMTLQPLFREGKLYLPETCVKQNADGESKDNTRVFINEEYDPYPIVNHDDLLDDLAYINHPLVRSTVPVPKDAIVERALAQVAARQRRSMDVI